MGNMLSATEEKEVLSAIKRAENKCSAEIKVHLDRWCKTNPLYKAQNKFIQLKMDQTEQGTIMAEIQ